MQERRTTRRALTLALAAMASGCFSVRSGDFVRTEPVPESEEVLSESFESTLEHWPTFAEPTLSFRIVRDRSVEFETVDLHQEVRSPRRMLFVLGGISAVALAITVTENVDDRDAATAGGILAIAATILAASALVAAPEETGELREGERDEVTEDRTEPLPAGTEVEVNVGNATATVRTGADGIVAVELVRDLLLNYFESSNGLRARVALPDGREIASALVNPTEWTSSCVSASRATDVFADPDDPASLLGTLLAGAVQPYRSEAGEAWFEIEYRGQAAWVSQEDTSRCWHRPLGDP